LEGHAERFRLVEVGMRTLLLEPLADLAPGEQLGLRVRLRAGSALESVSLVLVSHPSTVDDRVEVLRPLVLESLRAELAALRARLASLEPSDLVLSGLVDRRGVVVGGFDLHMPLDVRSGPHASKATFYQASGWMVMALQVHNLPGQEFWAPASARLLRADGTPVEVRQVRMDRVKLQGGEEGVIAVETEPLRPSDGPLRLELLDAEGRRLLRIDGLKPWRTRP
jgi:uncharacterized protein (TIGR02268 family)